MKQHAAQSKPMECTKCDETAVMHAAYSGSHLCDSHFRESVEKRVRRRIREDELIPSSATPDDPERWIIGLSGGKDSVVLTYLLHETFKHDPRIELLALTVHEGIEGYRDESIAASRELTSKLGVSHEIVTYEDELGIKMDSVVKTDPENMTACGYCGVFRRDLLARFANQFNASKLLTGHNLDDEAQTALMNLLEGDVEQMAKHFDASLGSFSKRGESSFVPRAKPLRDIPEKEVALYAHLRDLPVHMAKCPHSGEAYRGEIQELLLGLEDGHPGTRYAIMAGYEELAEMAAVKYKGDNSRPVQTCEECGSLTTQEICRKCGLVQSIHAT